MEDRRCDSCDLSDECSQAYKNTGCASWTPHQRRNGFAVLVIIGLFWAVLAAAALLIFHFINR